MKIEDKQELDNLRHSAAHLLAAAVMKLWPDTKRTIGPSIENGFYFDFEFKEPISEKDFPKIEGKMHELIKSWKGFERHELSPTDAKKEYPDNLYKHELIDEFAGEGQTLTFYKSGDYWDLCRGGHCEHPDREIKHFKLLSVAGAYWRGNEKNKMLTRIYGTIFKTKKELDDYLIMLEEAKKRDHKKLGRELDLYFIDEEVGQGLPLWTPKGTEVKHQLELFTWEIENRYGYQHVSTPYLGSSKLYETSGHLAHYKENMYQPIDMDGDLFYLRPMSCPHHIKMFAHKQRSYKELPIRYAEICDYNRFEKSGELMGMIRVRKFQLTDSHIFVAPEGLRDEFKNVCKLIDEAMRTLGIESKVSYRFSKRDPDDKKKYFPDDELWNKAEATMKQALDEIKLSYTEVEGEAAFYGPKLDVQICNVNGKEDTIITAQIDFLLPLRFEITYTDENGEKKRPIMIHRSVIGALERTFAFLLEHYAGAFPLWLAPIQVAILPIADRHQEKAKEAYDYLKSKGIRTEIDTDQKTLQAKIREHTLQKVPYLCIIGDKEIDEKNKIKLSIRTREGKDLGTIPLYEFCDKLLNDIEKKN